ncbi:Adaptive-response sensory-kinase SasA [uncultured archaeon]|nr:Adaptive-response sensory-kinase SasA [uncultured archaeon]
MKLYLRVLNPTSARVPPRSLPVVESASGVSGLVLPYSTSKIQGVTLHSLKGAICMFSNNICALPFDEVKAIQRQYLILAEKYRQYSVLPSDALVRDMEAAIHKFLVQTQSLQLRLQSIASEPVSAPRSSDYALLHNYLLSNGFPMASHPDCLAADLQFISTTEKSVSAQYARLQFFRQLSGNGYVPRLFPADLVEMAQRVVERYVPSRSRVRIRLDVPSPLPVCPVLADPMLFEIALGNLLSNAFKYARKEVVVSVVSQGGRARLMVQDDGVGMSELEASRAFVRGVENDNRIDSTGQGLADTVEIVGRTPGASIRILSRQNPTIFSIEFPLRLPADALDAAYGGPIRSGRGPIPPPAAAALFAPVPCGRTPAFGNTILIPYNYFTSI